MKSQSPTNNREIPTTSFPLIATEAPFIASAGLTSNSTKRRNEKRNKNRLMRDRKNAEGYCKHAVYRYVFCTRNKLTVNGDWTITEVLVDHPVTVNAERKVGIGSSEVKWEARKTGV
ncbi:hypothetical protein [Cellvibrio sp. PSBB006]|uniref:hypothetical protein n=1 Tax=Cellvibrio sp. PSBB006 TaxID=1987723 RepID=UPI0012FA797D|nr:hypothetical protein [Cellvibrio sp. PSBB006]